MYVVHLFSFQRSAARHLLLQWDAVPNLSRLINIGFTLGTVNNFLKKFLNFFVVFRTEGFSTSTTALFKSSLRGAARVILRVFIASSSEKHHFFEKSFFPHIIGTFTICLMYARANPYSPINYIEFMRYSPT